jgi:hypothetical protein
VNFETSIGRDGNGTQRQPASAADRIDDGAFGGERRRSFTMVERAQSL